MARHLNTITAPIKRHLINRFKHLNTTKTALDQLPIPLKLAQVKGEAEFTRRFFIHLASKHIEDEQSQWQIWQQLTTGSACIQVVENSELSRCFTASSTAKDYAKQCFTIYTICFWDAIQTNPQLANKMSTGFLEHFLPSVVASKPNFTAKDYKRQLATQLFDCWGVKPQIKESFTTGEVVEFKLLAKAKGYPTVALCMHEGKRLNNTREKAYKQTLKAMRQAAPNLPAPLLPTKQQAIKPLNRDD